MTAIQNDPNTNNQRPDGKQPTNGLAVAGLVVAILALVGSPAGAVSILAGLVALGLSITGLTVMARKGEVVTVAVIGLVLSVLAVGAASHFVGNRTATSVSTPTAAETPSYSTPGYASPSYSAPSYSTPSYSTPTYSAPTYEAPSYTPPPPDIYTYTITGPAKASSITYSTKGGGNSQATNARVPWTKKVESPGYASMPFAYVSAQNGGGGSISCKITGPSGTVIAENTAEGEYAIVTCQGG